MPKRTYQFTADTTPKAAIPANPKRLSYSIVNNGSVTVYTGADAGLTTVSGEPLVAGAMVSDDEDKEDVYVIAESGTCDLRITELLEA